MVEVLRNGGQPAPSVLGLVDACDFDYNTACWREAEPGFFFCPWTEADPCCADALAFSCLEPRPGSSTGERENSAWLADRSEERRVGKECSFRRAQKL